MFSYHKSCVSLKHTNYFSLSVFSLHHEDCLGNIVMDCDLQLGSLKEILIEVQ